MGQDRVQPTPIRKEEYEAFRNFVKDVHGSTRGHLSTEIENALREYRQGANKADRLQRIENDIATIMATVAEADSDGGQTIPTPSESDSTHARRLSKPAPNQSRSEKIEYLLRCFEDKELQTNGGGQVAPKTIRKIVKSEYSFQESTVDEYVDQIVEAVKDKYDAVPHPRHGKTLVWGHKLEDIKNEIEAEADNQIDQL